MCLAPFYNRRTINTCIVLPRVQLQNQWIKIKETIQNPVHSGYKINFPHFYMNRFLYSHSDDVLRLVKREGAHFKGEVHEKLLCNGSVGKLKNKILHYTYKDLHSYIKPEISLFY